MKFLFLSLALISTLLTARAQSSAAETEVLNAEKARFAAQAKKDYPALDKLIGDDLYYQHSNGDLDTKASFIQGIKDGKRNYDDIKIEESKVRLYENTAIINAVCMYYRKDKDGTPNNLHLRYTDVWVKRKGGWQMVTWQSFKLP
ncbi:MAG: nuclear transport factor 2 family protein [Cytophagales bacterium]|nr:MAG: nuclear transport factor 2 family protein [Cytophagales bacterium]